MKRFLSMLLAGSMIFTLAACGKKAAEPTPPAPSGNVETAAPQEKDLPTVNAKIATIFSATHPLGITAQRFSDLVAEKSDGKFAVTVFFSEQMGAMSEAFDSTTQGMLEFDIAPFSEPAKRWPAAGIIEAPYIFSSLEHCIKFLQDDSFNAIRDGLTENVGVTPIGSFYAGTRHMTTKNTSFTTPDEVKAAGLKIRASGTYTTAAVQLMGAAATPMALSEVYMALSNGTVDGQENPASTIYSNKFYEVQNYLLKTGHIVQPQAIFVNSAFFSSLPEEYQQIVTEAAQEAAEEANTLCIEKEEADINTLAGAECGMTVVEVDKDAFIAAAADYHSENMEQWGQEMYDAIMALK